MFSNFPKCAVTSGSPGIPNVSTDRPSFGATAKRENRPARVVSRCRRFTSRTRPTRPSRFCRSEENTFPAAFKIFESTKRACHHDYVFISEIRIYFPTCIQPVDALRDWTSRTHLYLLSSPSFFSFIRRTRIIDRWKYRHGRSVTNLFAETLLFLYCWRINKYRRWQCLRSWNDTREFDVILCWDKQTGGKKRERVVCWIAFNRFLSRFNSAKPGRLVKTGKNTIMFF